MEEPSLDSRAAVLSELGRTALYAARQAADLVRSSSGYDVRAKSSHRDLVTEVDTAAEQLIRTLIAQRRPDDAILGEEAGETPGTTSVRWVIDPIDGTANFVRGRADHAVAVAAEIDGTPVIGALVRVSDGQWIACDEHGALAAAPGQPGVRTDRTLATSLVSVSIPLSEPRRALAMAAFVDLLPHVQDFRRTGSTGCDLFDLAMGRLDAYLGIGTKPWDLAAGAAIVTAAGGTCLEIPDAAGHTLYALGHEPIARQIAAHALASITDHTQALDTTAALPTDLAQALSAAAGPHHHAGTRTQPPGPTPAVRHEPAPEAGGELAPGP